MGDQLITDPAEFEDLCDHIRASGMVAFDTEFVSEHTYRPVLCLLQFATRERCVAVDPFAVPDLSSWWNLMVDSDTTIVVHAGREEARFCLTHTQESPRQLIDVQIAEGLRSRSYPLSYEKLIERVLGKRIHGKETRTDWRRRPLSSRQIDYALEDVVYVLEVWDKQRQSLQKLNRLEWAECEFQRMLDETVAERTREGWRRISGIHRLRPRELAVARELSNWREDQADERDQPLRRILRDDLLLDLARRQPRSAQEVLATRDMSRSNYKRAVDEMVKCIEAGLAIPDSELPANVDSAKRDNRHDEHVLGQLLGIALANRCSELDVSKALVGTSADLRDLVRWLTDDRKRGTPPRLNEGWRAEVCGNLLTDVLSGDVTLRVADPNSDHPLVFERRTSS